MKKRGELIDEALELSRKYGQLNVPQEEIDMAKVARATFVNSILEDMTNHSGAKITQEEFDKVATLAEKEVALIDVLTKDAGQLTDIVLSSIVKTISEMEK